MNTVAKAAWVIFFLSVSVISYSNILILNGLTHEHTGKPGDIFRSGIEIQNASDEAKSVRLYQTDYWFSHTGESRHDAPGGHQRSNASWIRVTPTFVTLQPNEAITVNFEVNIPQNNALAGSYWSVIMVEGVQPPDPGNTSGGVSINTVVRYAVQVVSHIGDTGLRNLEFLNIAVNAENNSYQLDVDIANTGERFLRSDVSIELFDENGESKGIARVEKRRSYPGTSIRVSLDLAGIKPGNYSGVLIADCGDDYVFGANVELEL